MTPGSTDSEALSGATLARLARPTSTERTRIAVFADTHVHPDQHEHARAAVADVGRRDVDAVLHVGDLSGDGRPEAFDLFDEVVADLDVPLLAIPGNHDLAKSFDDHENLSLGAFEERYAPDGLPFVRRVGGVDLVGLNSAGGHGTLADTHDGRVREADVAWLDEALDDAENPVVAMHHNLPEMFARYESFRDATLPDHDGAPPVLRDPGPLVDCLAAHGIPLVLTGHMHIPALAETRGVREVQTPSLGTFPMAYSLVEVGPTGTTVRLVTVADEASLRDAHHARYHSKPNSQVLVTMAGVSLARFPLVDEGDAQQG